MGSHAFGIFATVVYIILTYISSLFLDCLVYMVVNRAFQASAVPPQGPASPYYGDTQLQAIEAEPLPRVYESASGKTVSRIGVIRRDRDSDWMTPLHTRFDIYLW